MKNSNLTTTLKTTVAFAKQKMLEAKQLREVKCKFCELGPLVVTLEQKAELAHMNRTDISLSGFHCSDKFHAKLFHDQLHEDDFRWSCCENDLLKKENGV